MNKKIIFITLMVLVLPSCKGSTNSSNLGNVSSSTNSSSLTSSTTSSIILDKVERISPNYYVDEYEYNTSFVDFPTFEESKWTTNLKFTLSADQTHYIVSDYLGGDRLLNTSELIIPAYYKGLPVEEIAQAAEGIGAFSELTWLKTVYLPHTIKKIEYGTFSLSAIEKLYIDCENLDDFDGRNWVFYPSQIPNYKGMDVYFGPNVKRIPQRLFYPNVTEPSFMPKINNVYFDEECRVESIGSHAFHDVTTFNEISLPDTVRVIEEYAFYKTSITSLKLPSALERIDNDAFEFTKLSHISVNDKLTHIGERAFAYSNLEGIDLAKTKIEVINDESFANITTLKGLNLPSTLMSIGTRAFMNNSLNDLVIPDNVEKIYEYAFYNSTNLERLYLGKSLKFIEERAFYNAENLISLEIASESLNDLKTGNNIFTNAGKNKGMQVYFLDGVKVVPNYLFFSTSNIDELCNIHTVSFPSSLTKVGKGAFYELEIERVNYRGSKTQFQQVNVMSDNSIFNVVDYGGN